MTPSVVFTDRDSVEVTTESGVLTCYRTNMGPGHGWHAVWLTKPDGEKVQPPSCFVLKQEIVDAIYAEETMPHVIGYEGGKIRVGTRVKVGDYSAGGAVAPEYRGVVTAISDPDGDVDDEGRSFGIPPYVTVKFDDGDEERYSTSSTATWHDQDAPWECEELEVIADGEE